MRSLITAILVILLVATSAAETLSGRCIKVADGDTITILTPAKRQVRIRLACIDCPEKRQPFGKRAKQFTSFLVFGRRVRVEVVDRDRYGRAVGWVYVQGPEGNELSVNEELIKAGLAWVYRRLDIKTNVKSPGTYNFRWLKRLDTIPWVFEAPGGIKSKA